MTAPAEHDYQAAARELGISEDWLRANIAKLPHYKKSLAQSGRGRGKVTFSDDHLAEIRLMFERRPAEPKRGVVTRRRAS